MSTAAGHPRHRLIDLFQSPVRFSIMAALSHAESFDFKDLRDAIQIKQLSALEQAGYLQIRKTFAGKLPRTSASLTDNGRSAWTAHLQTLRDIAGS
jgi:DNA-binding HxlR family transcriptional regulator